MTHAIAQSTGTYRLYGAWGCPFCHRVLAGLHVTGLAEHMPISWMKESKREGGWEVKDGDDPLFDARFIKDIYAASEPSVEHRPAVPLLIDEETKAIVSTDSPDMLRFVSKGFAGKYEPKINLCPDDLRDDIDNLNPWLHDNINRAVYGVGFALEQSAYEEKAYALFEALDVVEKRLTGSKFLFGDRLTESDIFLFATLLRFDSIYNPLFRCSLKRIAGYPEMSRFLEHLRDDPAMKLSYDFGSSKRHYYKSLISTKVGTIDPNPSGIVPI